MTISYTDHFWKLFFRWKGSLWKTIHKDLAVFLILYFSISALYRFMLTKEQRRTFEILAQNFDGYTEHIPLTFMLGFYVGMVVKRWWDQFQRVPWPDNLLYWISAYIRGSAEETRLIRRTIARYCVLTCVVGWRSISVRVRKRFPTLKHVINIGLMTEEELVLFEKIQIRFDPHKQWFIPLNWVLSILIKCYQEEKISHVNELRQLIQELETYRKGFMELFIYDWITIPLVYTQVAVVATYGYFALCLIGRQYIQPDPDPPLVNHKPQIDLYVPIFTILQFFFFVGWLKVGEDLMNPFGEDDEDFEFNYLLDRHLEMSFYIVDELHGSMPRMVDTGLRAGQACAPHTRASGRVQDKAPRSHLESMAMRPTDMEILIPSILRFNQVTKTKPPRSPSPRTPTKRFRNIVNRVVDATRVESAASPTEDHNLTGDQL